MTAKFLLIIFGLLLILFMVGYNRENFCAIQYPVCDNYCQKAKLDMCVSLKKDGRYSGPC